jgi:hypothetical protein
MSARSNHLRQKQIQDAILYFRSEWLVFEGAPILGPPVAQVKPLPSNCASLHCQPQLNGLVGGKGQFPQLPTYPRPPP